MLQELLEWGADVDAVRLGDNRTALMVACARERPGAVALLLRYGADVERTDANGIVYNKGSFTIECVLLL